MSDAPRASSTSARRPAQGSDPRSVRSVTLGFSLIDALMDNPEPMALKDLALAAGMPSAKAHAYLMSFRTVGLVQQESNARYALGPYALSLGLASLSRLEVREASKAPMHEFHRATKCGVHLSVWSGTHPVIVSRIDDSSTRSPFTIRVGATLPLGISATGHVFLAFLPDSWDHLEQDPGRSRGDLATLEGTVQRTRFSGIARADLRLHSGLFGVAAPVFDHDDQLAGALTAIAPTDILGSTREEETAAALVEAASKTTRALGGPR